MKDLAAALAQLRAQHRYRSRAVLDSPQGAEIVVDGRRYLSFCSNDYLGLANHPRVIAALQAGAEKYGAGSGASHLITGHQRPHHELEEALAAYTGRPRALLFSTGYMANLGVVTALARRGDVIFEDRLNHASLLDAGLLSGARLKRYAHSDVAHLARQLDRSPSSQTGNAPLTTLSPPAKVDSSLPSPASGRGAGGEALDTHDKPNPPARLPEDLLTHARELRHGATDAEQLLWQLLRNRRLANAKFRRQHPLGRYIADFYCDEQRLVIELDGGQHSEQESYDEQRTAFLRAQGLKVIRYWNHHVLSQTEAVLEDIWRHVTRRDLPPSPPAPLPATGEGSKSPAPVSAESIARPAPVGDEGPSIHSSPTAPLPQAGRTQRGGHSHRGEGQPIRSSPTLPLPQAGEGWGEDAESGNDPDPRPAMFITDGVFSMDGDLAPLPALARLARQHQAWLMVDDAHGLGVIGAHGRGTVEHYGLGVEDVPILVGTLGKAFGTFGAFVAGSEELIETLIQRARTYIYTTALPPAVAHATLTSLRLIAEESWRRVHLAALVQRFRAGAAQLGLELMPSTTPIQPLLVGDEERALQLSAALKERGMYVSAIRPPTVPSGTARLRITLCAAHREQDVDQLLAALEAVL